MGARAGAHSVVQAGSDSGPDQGGGSQMKQVDLSVLENERTYSLVGQWSSAKRNEDGCQGLG